MAENGHEGLVVLDRNDVARLLPMRECIDVMAAALATVARGNAILPLRPMIRLPDSPNIFALMPAYLGEPKSVGVKVLTVFPVNHGTPIDAHQGAVLLFEADHGRLLAILDATTVTAIRTAAVSAVATRLLARDDAEDLAILGAGTQGTMHLEAMTVVRPIRRVHVWSRTTEHAAPLAQLARERFDLQADVASTPAHAVERASIVCTTTASPTPVLEGASLRPGTHINAVGACIPTTRELDTEAVRRARALRRSARVGARRAGRHPHAARGGRDLHRPHRRRGRRAAVGEGRRPSGARATTRSRSSSRSAWPSRISLPRITSIARRRRRNRQLDRARRRTRGGGDRGNPHNA